MPTLQLYKVPDYVHGANVPATHFERPAGTTSGAAPTKLEHQDSLVGAGLAKVHGSTRQGASVCRCARCLASLGTRWSTRTHLWADVWRA